jgi:hypothetical protein
MIRSRFVFGALASVLALGACQHQEDDTPSPRAQQLVGQAWLLTETRLNNQVTGRDTTVKDRSNWLFNTDKSCWQAIWYGGFWSAAQQGQWRLTNQDQELHITDHKGAQHDYDILQLDATVLRLRWEEHAGEVHEDTFTR